MDTVTYCVTYDLVTEESAENGDVAERGFLVACRCELPLPPEVVGDAVSAWRAEHGVDIPVDTSYYEEDDPHADDYALERACAEIVREYGCTETSSSRMSSGCWFIWYDDAWGAETEDGTIATRSGGVHFDGLTDEQIRRVEWLAFKAGSLRDAVIPMALV